MSTSSGRSSGDSELTTSTSTLPSATTRHQWSVREKNPKNIPILRIQCVREVPDVTQDLMTLQLALAVFRIFISTTKTGVVLSPMTSEYLRNSNSTAYFEWHKNFDLVSTSREMSQFFGVFFCEHSWHYRNNVTRWRWINKTLLRKTCCTHNNELRLASRFPKNDIAVPTKFFVLFWFVLVFWLFLVLVSATNFKPELQLEAITLSKMLWLVPPPSRHVACKIHCFTKRLTPRVI